VTEPIDLRDLDRRVHELEHVVSWLCWLLLAGAVVLVVAVAG
jgi:hypothetical protein